MTELHHQWDTKIEIVSFIFGALGSISDALTTYLSSLQATDVSVHQLQTAVVLKTVIIL